MCSFDFSRAQERLPQTPKVIIRTRNPQFQTMILSHSLPKRLRRQPPRHPQISKSTGAKVKSNFCLFRRMGIPFSFVVES